MEILRKVKIGERLPKKEGVYNGINKEGKSCLFIYKEGEENTIRDKLEYWYEPIEIELKSEEMLPLERRGLFTVCFSSDEVQDYAEELEKALEAAELEIASKEEVDKIAKKRYTKALKFTELCKTFPEELQEQDWIEALKIAAGIK